MRTLILSLTLCGLSITATEAADAQTPPPKAQPAQPPTAPGTSDPSKTFYALGVLLSRSLESFALSPAELDLVTAGLRDGALKKSPLADAEAYGPKVQELQTARMAIVAARQKDLGKAYLEKAAAAQGATRTASGIVVTSLKPGTGAAPTASDQVKVHYEGRLIDGTIFDSSIQRGEPATFPLRGVIPCWTEAVQLMKVGGKSRLVCPPDLAYGERGSPPRIAGGATLVFEVELLGIVKP